MIKKTIKYLYIYILPIYIRSAIINKYSSEVTKIDHLYFHQSPREAQISLQFIIDNPCKNGNEEC
jgi:hypothetical protein